MRNALLLTGAAARISQEVALIDQLIEHRQLNIDQENTMLAGFSSGALNIAAINACFRTEQPLSWDKHFKEDLLFKAKTADVLNTGKTLPFNTTPLRNMLNGFLDKAGMKNFDQCRFNTYILAFSYRRLSTIWVHNRNKHHNESKLLPLLMATTAIPLIFPDQPIVNNNPKNQKFLKGNFADGGIGGSFKRFEKHLKKEFRQNGPFDNIYIVSPMREVVKEDFDALKALIPASDRFKMDLKEFKVLRLFLEMISQNGFDTFVKRLHRWSRKHKIASNIYISIPALEKNFPILNFDFQQEQYEAVSDWARKHPEKVCIPIHQYVRKFENSPLRKIRVSLKRKLIHHIRSWRNR
jgi:hypothetical protein